MISIPNPHNPYRSNVQGKANEPITVAALLDRAWRETAPDRRSGKAGAPIGRRENGEASPDVASPDGAATGGAATESAATESAAAPDWTLEAIYDRLEHNAPRIAIIGGSADHPAHIMDPGTVARAALAIWREGGVPFHFATPVLCDGTAQNNAGMSYSLQSRNAIAEIVVNQMEAHSYHGAFVIQGCDKQPLGVVSALAHLDRLRRLRGEHPVYATFAPAHVLRGGTIPDETMDELRELAEEAERRGHGDIAEDIREAASYILQCSSNTSFQGVFERAVGAGLLDEERHKALEKKLAVHTCDAKGGICAFHGTGNSSRDVTAGLGLVHPALELLVEPPTQEQVDAAVSSLFRMLTNPSCSVAELVRANIANAIRLHSAGGGSSNLVMHIVGAMQYAGFHFSLYDMEAILAEHPVPDLFDYSLTEGRDIFALAAQCCSGQIRGMETLMYELVRCGVPMDLDAPTAAGRTWRERLADERGLSAAGVAENPIILDRPRRAFSGVDVLRGNFFESSVVKISGMPTKQLDHFDEKAAFVLYFENEDAANRALLDVRMLERLRDQRVFGRDAMAAMAVANAGPEAVDAAALRAMPYEALFDAMIEREWMRLAVVISGQGPEAFGMPEMFTPMQHINASRRLRRLTTLISDGRYSGVTFGAAVGHVVPEAMRDGGMLYLQDGDVLLLRFRARRIDWLDAGKFAAIAEAAAGAAPADPGAMRAVIAGMPADVDAIRAERREPAAARLARLRQRQRFVAASNRLVHCTDAAHGVVPAAVAEEAVLNWREVPRSGTAGFEAAAARESL